MSETTNEPQPGADEDGFGGDAPQPAGVELEPENFDTAEANDDEDVPAALERTTDDGPGFDNEDELPAEDFESFAESDVETEGNA